MSLPIDITTIVAYGNICSYLAANDFSQKKLLNGRYFNTGLPLKLSNCARLVEWNYNRNPDDTTLIDTGNYLLQLCGKYVAEAQIIIGSGSSGTIINPATGIVSTIRAVYLEFIVGITSSPVSVNGVNVTLPNNGDSSITIPVPNILNASIGVVKDGVSLPTSQTDRLSFAPIYTTNSVTITLNPTGAVFNTNDLYVITGLQYVAV